MFLADEFPERDLQEWLDAYWAKDVQALFRLERRSSFLRFAELLMVQSGGMFEATKFARPCEVSRTTIANYLAVLEATYIVHVVRPFSGNRTSEIVAAPKVYAFDTGFVCAMRGWDRLRADDRGPLWEHYVLNEIAARTQSRRVLYWRDKQGHEIDFVVAPRGKPVVAIECKWSSKEFDPASLVSFRGRHPGGENFVVASDVDAPFHRTFGDVRATFVGLDGLVARLVHRGR
jgi:predicted AAA+ superfamily ATPase